ncbi:MAG: ABC transporter ATP-binding protein [bacterium]|nr:ABC transporter ATP-binding protein [bacterium]
MSDIADSRVAPETLKDYFKSLKQTGAVFSWLWKEMTDEVARRYARRVLGWAVFLSTTAMLKPAAISAIFSGLQTMNMPFVYMGLAVFAFLFLARRMAGFLHGRALEYFQALAIGKLDDRITELFFEKSIGQHVQDGSHLTAGNVEKARGRIFTVFGIVLFDAIPTVLSILAAFVALSIVSPICGAVMTVVMAGYLLIAALLNKEVMRVCVPLDRRYRRLNRRRFSRWDNVGWVQINTREKTELQEMDGEFRSIAGEDRDFWVEYIKKAIRRDDFSSIALFGIILYGIHEVLVGNWLIGTLYATVTWSTFLSENLRRVGMLERNVSYHIPSIKAMIDTLTLKPKVVVKENAIRLNGEPSVSVEFQNVGFSYEPSVMEARETGETEKLAHVLRGISFRVNPGEKVALIGPSGSGKSTIMNLLLRSMDPQTGTIRVSGHDLRDIDLWEWRKKLGYIPQNSIIFDGTIRDNLTYGLNSEELSVINSENLWKFAEKMRVNFEGRLHNGLLTKVGRDGIKLSGGEAQRIMIAGAILKKPRFMIIDEPTSSLDSITEKEVQEGISAALQGGVGAIIIAHRLSTVRSLCNKFIILRRAGTLKAGEGQIEAIGNSFEELHEKSPTFRKLLDCQNVAL